MAPKSRFGLLVVIVSLALMTLASRSEATLGCFDSGGTMVATCDMASDCDVVGGISCSGGFCACFDGLGGTMDCPCLQVVAPTPTPTDSPIPTPTNTPGCGDGVVTAPETCDPPGSAAGQNGAKCRADCTFCGDGIKNGGKYCSEPFFVFVACATDADCEDIGSCVKETCDPGNDPSCLPDCSGRIHNDPALIRYGVGNNGSDLLYVHGAIQNDRLIPVDQQAVTVRLLDRTSTPPNKVIYEAQVPAGAGMTVRKTKSRTFYKFKNSDAKLNGSGIAMFKVAKDRDFYRVNVWAWDANHQLANALPDMTVELVFANQRWTSPGNWRKTGRGWYMFLK